MKAIAVIVAVTALAAASSAAGASFTGAYKNDMATGTALTVPGLTSATTMGAGFFKGVGMSVDRDGATVASAYECIFWNTPGAPTAASGVCQVNEGPRDTYSEQIVCAAADPKDQTAFCWGAMVGTGGRYVGKAGNFSQMGSNSGGSLQGAWKN